MFKRANKSTYFLSEKIEIKSTESKGLGIFAKEKICKRELIESSPVILFNCAIIHEWNETVGGTHILNDYVFMWKNNQFAVGLGYTSLYNHDNDPNSTWRPTWMMKKDILQNEELTGPRIQILALRDIEPGEEICIHYNRGSGDLSFTPGGSVTDHGQMTPESIEEFKNRGGGKVYARKK